MYFSELNYINYNISLHSTSGKTEAVYAISTTASEALILRWNKNMYIVIMNKSNLSEHIVFF